MYRVWIVLGGQITLKLGAEPVVVCTPVVPLADEGQRAGRVQSQVPLSYLRMDQLAAFAAPQRGRVGLGFAERAAAAVFVQSNCKVPSGRTEIISNLMSFGDVAIHSYGKCGSCVQPYLLTQALCYQPGCLTQDRKGVVAGRPTTLP